MPLSKNCLFDSEKLWHDLFVRLKVCLETVLKLKGHQYETPCNIYIASVKTYPLEIDEYSELINEWLMYYVKINLLVNQWDEEFGSS